MDKLEFAKYRNKLKKTQKQMAELLGTSLKAVHSYEQGWRKVPIHVERQIFFLVSRLERKGKKSQPCWVIKKCTPEQKHNCPTWEFGAGDMCWFINGTICDGVIQKGWKEKMEICRNCKVFGLLL